MRSLLFVIVASVFPCLSPAAMACSPASEDFIPSTITSLSPAKDVPSGATQLKVVGPDRLSATNQRMSLNVLEVVDGELAEDVVHVNFSNVDGCNSYVAHLPSGGVYITVLPMRYRDGEPVTDDEGNREFGPLFYRDVALGLPAEDRTPEFAEYAEYADFQDFSFYDADRAGCVYDGEETVEAWRECVEPGEYVALECADNNGGGLICGESDLFSGRPDDLRRGYSPWQDRGASIPYWMAALAVLVGSGYFVWRVRKAKA
jgi:hypothetical protein